jgi:hypothetical protein
VADVSHEGDSDTLLPRLVYGESGGLCHGQVPEGAVTVEHDQRLRLIEYGDFRRRVEASGGEAVAVAVGAAGTMGTHAAQVVVDQQPGDQGCVICVETGAAEALGDEFQQAILAHADEVAWG